VAEVLGYKNRHRKHWMSEGMWKKIEGRMYIKAKMTICKTKHKKGEPQVKYRKKGCEVKHGTHADCRKWMSD
jgi:squalene cyclase